jgi:hypothetical protein
VKCRQKFQNVRLSLLMALPVSASNSQPQDNQLEPATPGRRHGQIVFKESHRGKQERKRVRQEAWVFYFVIFSLLAL